MATDFDGNEVGVVLPIGQSYRIYKRPCEEMAVLGNHAGHAYRMTETNCLAWCKGYGRKTLARLCEEAAGSHWDHVWNGDYWCPGMTDGDMMCGFPTTHERHLWDNEIDGDVVKTYWCKGVGDAVTEQFNKVNGNEGPVESSIPWSDDVTTITPQPPDNGMLFGIHDDNGNSLIEFRVKDGRVEAKYYDSDIDEATRRFVAFLRDQEVQQG